ncbi:hypothetical protein ES708_28817 [subsurface metagenome]
MRTLRNWLRVLSAAPTISLPANMIDPDGRTSPGKSPMIASAVNDFPDPDSPMSPSLAPGSRLKLSESTNRRSLAATSAEGGVVNDRFLTCKIADDDSSAAGSADNFSGDSSDFGSRSGSS